MGACLEQMLYLPDLDGLQIKQWLTDVMAIVPFETAEELSRSFSKQFTITNEEDEDKDWDCKLVCVKGGKMRSNELAHLRQEQSTDGNPS
jgi:hypothetical protein